jgi:SAM-dependent methyltransferase
VSGEAKERHRLAARLRGAGLEIGPSNNPVALPPGARVRYVDKFPSEIIRTLNPDIPANEALVEPDILAPAENLQEIADGSEDFLIASHVLEHIPDPIEALIEWHRIVKPHGHVYLCLPDMRGTFDAGRERTSLTHLIEDHRLGPDHPDRKARDLAHFVEWARVVNKLTNPRQAAFWGDALRRARYPIHFHCWLPEDVAELVGWLAEGGHRFRILDTDAASDQSEFALLLERESSERSRAQRHLERGRRPGG